MPDDKLPSINDFLNEEDENKLPSVEEFIAKEELNEEDTISIEDANGNPFLEVTDVVKAPEWSELIRMVNDVRESIPDIPEVKYYDDKLKKLEEHIEEVKENIPEVKDYDITIESICDQVDSLRLSVDNIKVIDSDKNLIDELKELRYGKSIWRLLLIIALFCLVFESLLGIPNKDRLKTNLE